MVVLDLRVKRIFACTLGNVVRTIFNTGLIDASFEKPRRRCSFYSLMAIQAVRYSCNRSRATCNL